MDLVSSVDCLKDKSLELTLDEMGVFVMVPIHRSIIYVFPVPAGELYGFNFAWVDDRSQLGDIGCDDEQPPLPDKRNMPFSWNVRGDDTNSVGAGK